MNKLTSLIFFIVILTFSIVMTVRLTNDFKKNSPEEVTIEKFQKIESNKKKKKLLDSIFALEIRTRVGNSSVIIGSGTGFAIARDKEKGVSYAITNHHVCDAALGDDNAFVHGVRSEDNEFIVIPDTPKVDVVFTIVGAEKTMDLCLLKTLQDIEPLNLSKKELDQFDELFVIGAPDGNFPIILETFFSGYLDRSMIPSLRTKENRGLIVISEQLLPGHSGSPVFDSNNNVIGIAFATPLRAVILGTPITNYGSLAIPSGDIEEFLKSYGINP